MSSLHQKLEEEQREAAARGKKSMCQNAVDGVTNCFAENKPKVEHLCGDLKRKGACTKFGEFTKNLFLIRPLGRMKNPQELVAELRGSITLSPEFPLKGFVLWNELAFWIGVLSQVCLLTHVQHCITQQEVEHPAFEPLSHAGSRHAFG